MAKKFICLVLTAIMLSAVFAINTNAAISTSMTYVDESFTKPTEYLGTDNYRPEGWTIAGLHGTVDTRPLAVARITDDGYVELMKGEHNGNGGMTYTLSKSVPSEFTLMYDICFHEDPNGRQIYVAPSLGGYNLSWTASGQISDAGSSIKVSNVTAEMYGSWYTRVVQVKNGVASFYHKKHGDANFTALKENVPCVTTTSADLFYVYSNNATAKVWIDNVKIFSGTYMTGASSTVERIFIQTHKYATHKTTGAVTEVALDAAEDTANYTYRTEDEYKYKFKGTMNVTSASVAPVSTGTAKPIMTIYDQKGKIIDMVFNDAVLSYDDGNSYTLETGLYTQAEYDKMKGYTLEIYLWNSFSTLMPQSAAYSTTIQ